MKICAFNDFRIGRVKDDRVIDLSEVAGPQIVAQRPEFRMLSFIEEFERLRPAIEACEGPSLALADVQLRAPVPHPRKLLMAQGNYHENIPTPARPLGMFLKPPSAVLDPGATVVLPPDDGEIFHHEAELAVVIGKRARNVSREEALDYVFGYTCIIDVSLRSPVAGVGLTAKGFDTFAPLGPWIATADEIPDPQTLDVRLWESGQTRQVYNTDDMEHPVAALIAWASNKVTLEPGDVIGCGTNHQGLGPMQDGEICELEIEKIGRLSVQVSDPLKRQWPFKIDEGIGKWVRDWKSTGVMSSQENVYMRRIK
ncbi:MAG: fumarylacetoacetate hydrolase family protein [Pseudomonadota bacterium]|jgi:2-keto-4-pentenoate hydratase/2-oxohepta-3-ene-1,7-dioic acid hydratase in catechol pathway